MIHKLKIWPEPFEEIRLGVKLYEVRNGVVAQRVFRGGDVLLLEEWNPSTTSYTGRSQYVEVQQALQLWETPEQWGIRANLTVLQIRRIKTP